MARDGGGRTGGGRKHVAPSPSRSSSPAPRASRRTVAKEDKDAAARSRSPPASTTKGGRGAAGEKAASTDGAPVKLPEAHVMVSGCQDKTIGERISGEYEPHTMNHGKVVFRKVKHSKGHNVYIYYWDERDGPDQCGWWFGPEVGGNQVWAYHPSRTAASPPASDWNVPHDGNIDRTFSVSAMSPRVSEPPTKQARTESAPTATERPRDKKEKKEKAVEPPAEESRRERREKRTEDDYGGNAREKGGKDTSRRRRVEVSEDEEERKVASRSRKARTASPVERTRDDGRKAKEATSPPPEKNSEKSGAAKPGTRAYYLEINKRREEEAKQQKEEGTGGEDRKREKEVAREKEKERGGRARAREAEQDDDDDDRGKSRSRGKARGGRAASVAQGKDEDAPRSGRVRERDASRGGRGQDDDAPRGGRGRDDDAPRAGRRDDDTPRAGRDEDGKRQDGKRREPVQRSESPTPPKREERARGGRERDESPRRGRDESAPHRRDEGRRGGDRGEVSRRAGREDDDRPRRDDDTRRRDRDDDDRPRRDEDKRRRDRDEDERPRREEDGRRRGDVDDRGRRDEDAPRRRDRDDDDRPRRDDDGRRRDRHDDDRPRRDDDRRRDQDDRRPSGRDDDRRRGGGRDDDRRPQRTNEEDRKRRDEDDRETRNRPDERRRRDDEERDTRRREDSGRNAEEDKKRELQKREKEEEHKRKEEEIQKKRDAKRREEDEKRKAEDEKRRIENDEKRKEEKQKQEEAERKKAEEEREKAEAAKKQAEEEELALRQQQATLNVLRVLQQLSNANPDNFQSLKADLARVMQTELPQTGPQEEILKTEAGRVLEHAQHYVEQVKQQAEREKKQKEEQEATARRLLQELEQLVAVAEANAEKVTATAAPLADESELEYAQVFMIARNAEEAGNLAIQSCSACADFLSSKRAVIDEAESLRTESVALITALQPRIKVAARKATDALRQAKQSKDKVIKRCAASRRLSKQDLMFKKFDKDGDGYLNVKEIIDYAKTEWGFDIPTESLEKITRQLVENGKGVDPDKFYQLKAAVGIARDEARGAVRKALREERERKEREAQEARQAVVAEKKAAAVKVLEEVNALVSQKLEPALKGAEGEADALAANANNLEVSTLRAAARKVEHAGAAAEVLLKEAKTRLEALQQQVEETTELVAPMAADLQKVRNTCQNGTARLGKVVNTADAAHQLAYHWVISDYEGCRMEVAATLQACMEASGGKVEDIFDAVAKTNPDYTTKQDIIKYVASQSSSVDQEKFKEKLDRVFSSFMSGVNPDDLDAAAAAADSAKTDAEKKGDGGGADTSKADKPESEKASTEKKTDAKDEENGKDSMDAKEEGDAKEATNAEGEDAKNKVETKTDAANTDRKDDEKVVETDGDAKRKPTANSTPPKGDDLQISREEFPRLSRLLYKVIKEIVLTDNLLIEQSRQIRRMDINEVMEVTHGPSLDPAIGIYRIGVRAFKDGLTGWVTVAGNAGVTFLQPCACIFRSVSQGNPLSSELRDLEGTNTIMELKEGQILELLDWSRTSRSTLGVTRVKVRALGSSIVGWTTTQNNEGQVFTGPA